MVHVELEELKSKFYEIGKSGRLITKEEETVFSSLDNYQREQLTNEYVNGFRDRMGIA